MIDHIACTPGLKRAWIKDSSAVLYADKWISNYGNVVSDHFPVYSRFRWNDENRNADVKPLNTSAFTLTQNEGCIDFKLNNDINTSFVKLNIYDLSGRLLYRLEDHSFCSPSTHQWYYFEFRDSHEGIVHSGIFQLMSDGTLAYR
jgi:hypothetical protein